MTNCDHCGWCLVVSYYEDCPRCGTPDPAVEFQKDHEATK